MAAARAPLIIPFLVMSTSRYNGASFCRHCLVAGQRAGEARFAFELVLADASAAGAELAHLEVAGLGHELGEERRVVSHDGAALLADKRDYFGDVAQRLVDLLLAVDLFLHLLLLSHPQLSPSLVKDLLKSGLFLRLHLLLQVLLPFPLLLFTPDYLAGFVELLVLAGPAVRQLYEILRFSLLAFCFVIVEALGGGLV